MNARSGNIFLLDFVFIHRCVVLFMRVGKCVFVENTAGRDQYFANESGGMVVKLRKINPHNTGKCCNKNTVMGRNIKCNRSFKQIRLYPRKAFLVLQKYTYVHSSGEHSIVYSASERDDDAQPCLFAHIMIHVYFTDRNGILFRDVDGDDGYSV